MLQVVTKLLQKNSDVAFAPHQLRRSFVRSPTEITEYARYAHEGKLNEQSNDYSRRDCDACNADLGLSLQLEQFVVRTRCKLWALQ